MDKEQFEQKLTEVAEWDYPYVQGNDSTITFKRIGKARLNEEQQLWAFPVVQEMKIQPRECEHCQKWCEQGCRTESRKLMIPQPHWRHKCITCGMHQDPRDGTWTANGYRISQIWNEYFRKLRQSKTK